MADQGEFLEANMEREDCRIHCHLHSRKRSQRLLAIWTILILLSLPAIVRGQICTNDAGCFPPIGNLALGRTINASSTCIPGSQYCIFGTPGPDCFTCEPNGLFSPASLNDNNNGSFWLSEIGSDETVTLQINFEAPVLFEGMTMVWVSPRPQSMILERSHDNGQTWHVYRYYSASCMTSFMMEDTTDFTSSTVFNSTDPICTSVESRLNPETNGLVTFSTSQHLPAGTSTEEVTAYTLITNLRTRLVRHFPLVAASDLTQYYAVGEWFVEGTCMCNGHASVCAPAPGGEMNQDKEVYAGCSCQHNTAGTHCEQCAVGFNNAPWAAGTETEANACEECMCNGHALDCVYMESQMSAVCIDCSDNTTGDQCDQCEPMFYQDIFAMLNDPNVCIACDCDQAGIVDEGVCDSEGQCTCKENVESARCSLCEDGYWNLTTGNPLGCQECDCDPDGTQAVGGSGLLFLCDKDSGQCVCKENVVGERCDRCQDGFFNLANGCLSCQCNLAGSESPVCDQDSPVAQCPCRPNIDSSTCAAPMPDNYFRLLDEVLFEAELADFSEGTEVVMPVGDGETAFTGRGFISLPSLGQVTFTVSVATETQYELIIRFMPTSAVGLVTLTIESLGPVTLDLNCDPTNDTVSRIYIQTLPDQEFYVFDSVCLSNCAQYNVTLATLGSDLLLDSLLLLPDVSATSEFYASRIAENPGDELLIESCLPRAASTSLEFGCQEILFSLSVEFFGQVFVCDCNSTTTAALNGTCDAFGGFCSCLAGVGGRQCDSCLNGWFNFSSSTGCQACDCDVTGADSAVCDLESGQCSCKNGVGERTCSECQPGFFNFTQNGCSPCECSEYAVSMECDDLGQCTCPSGVGGLKCDQCLPERYNISSTGCLNCSCDPLGSTSSVCDTTTGQCPCVERVVARDCSECPVGHFITDGVTRDRCVECQCSGRSDTCVADTENFALAAIHSNFTVLCAQSPTDCSDGWQLLSLDDTPFGPSDGAGLGYILFLNNNPQLVAPGKYLGDQRASYSLQFRVEVSVSESATLKTDSNFISLMGSLLDTPLVATFPAPEMVMDGLATGRLLLYSVPLVESYWRVGTASGPTASYFQLLSLLSNITELSFTADFTQDLVEFVRIRETSLETVVSATEPLLSPDLVLLTSPFPVESCECPMNYTGVSCQECARGYARPSGDPADVCLRCNCNNLTLDCDVSSGICINCTGNSEGSNCERCISGFYGDPTRGIPCLPCECPTLANSFSPTCFLDSDDLPTCDSCDPGYTGRNCGLCMDGFFGNPFLGRCTTCECNGNVDPASPGPVCNMTTGQCLNCTNNTIGFECEFCAPGNFGDPTLGIPCTACTCDPQGTSGDCDPLFGTCLCLPNVMGSRCDQCEDGFWGLSLGQDTGCIPCDCCTNGSLSDICNKDTGRCDCLPNVGSGQDDKCCMCTPGFFNFSEDSGCEVCNCSALSVTGECDQVSGQCQCQEGAVGLKCDDCAFGFIGRVPDCEPCHECFHQWFTTITDIAEQVSNLQTMVELMITGNYDNYTVAGIEAEVARLLEQLEMANQTLNNVTIQLSEVEELEQMVQELNANLTELNDLVIEIEQQLDTSERMLDVANAFDGSVNGTTAQDVQTQLLFYNTTVAALAEEANASLAVLMQNQTRVYELWAEADNITMTAETLVASLAQYENDSQTAAALVDDFWNDFDSLRANLTILNMTASSLTSQLQTLLEEAANASADVASANATLQSFLLQLQQRSTEIEAALQQAQQLNSSVEDTQMAALQTLNSTAALLDLSTFAVSEAESTLDTINSALAEAESVSQQLNTAKSLAQAVLDITLPSLESVTELATQLNESILPDELVEEIVANATASRVLAEQTLIIAENASNAVMAAQSLVEQVQSDINCTNTTLQRVEETIPRIERLLNETEQYLEQAAEGAAVVAEQAGEAELTYSEANDTIQRADALGMENRQRARDVLAQSTEIARQSEQSESEFQQVVANYTALQMDVNATYSEEFDNLQTAERLQNEANQLNATANAISVDDILGLLNEYSAETERVESLTNEVAALQQEAEALTESFNEAAERLQRCYKTP